MTGGLFTLFCIDTCAILDLFGRKYPRDLYPNLWPAFESAVVQGTIISVREVYREIKSRDDAVADWAKGHRDLFHDPDDAQLAELARITDAHPACLDILKRKPVLADPWVIAAAGAWDLTAVTSEGVDSPKRIPAVCATEGIRCTDLLGMFRGLNWTFAASGRSAGASDDAVTASDSA
jgi:hypothetical protein